MDNSYRTLQPSEKNLMARMVAGEVSWITCLQKQMDRSTVKTIDTYGSLSFNIDCEKCSMLRDGPIITATCADSDTIEEVGPYINFIIFIKDGLISELQVYKDDGGPIQTTINAASLSVEFDKSRVINA